MELVVFDLDGTLLNRQSVISAYTSETLSTLDESPASPGVAGVKAAVGIAPFYAKRRGAL